MQFPLYSTQYEQKVIHILMGLGGGGGGVWMFSGLVCFPFFNVQEMEIAAP